MDPAEQDVADAEQDLDDDDVAAVLALVAEAQDADGVRPVSEAAELALRGGGQGVRHVLVRDGDGVLLGYGQVDTTVRPASAELVVRPTARRRGVGRALLEALVDEASPPVRVWAHGDTDAARALADAVGWARDRELLQMRRPLPGPEPLPAVEVPPGVHLRTFDPATDVEEWLAVNAAAFADHREQGRWTSSDLAARIGEPWFDASGFLVAVDDDGRMLGFHWTKVPGDGTGEVYVVGVSPAAQGRGLGRVLTLAGLHHLADRDLSAVTLYVDADNAAAMRLYRGLGFDVVTTDVQYSSG